MRRKRERADIQYHYSCSIQHYIIFQQDNAPAHSSKRTKAYLASLGISLLSWPPNSPDLSPIENIWGLIKRKLKGKAFPNRDLLWEAIKFEWDSLNPSYFHALVRSMPNRLSATLSANGGYCGY